MRRDLAVRPLQAFLVFPSVKKTLNIWTLHHTHALLLGIQMNSTFKHYWQFLKKLNTDLPYNPSVLLLGVYPREMKIHMHTKTCSQMPEAPLFKIVKT
jgi:hypothetical protein